MRVGGGVVHQNEMRTTAYRVPGCHPMPAGRRQQQQPYKLDILANPSPADRQKQFFTHYGRILFNSGEECTSGRISW